MCAMNGITADVKTKVDKLRRCLLTGAFEGGSNYWYMIEEYKFPEGVTYADFREGGRFTDPEDYWHPATIIPFHKGCAVVISDREADPDNDKERWTLDRPALIRGWNVMRDKFPRHYADAISENDDADTADVYLQCCLFGDLVYG